MPTVPVAYKLKIPDCKELDSDEPVQLKPGEQFLDDDGKAFVCGGRPCTGRYFRLRNAQPESKPMKLTELLADIVAAKGDNCPGSRMHDRLCEWSKVVACAAEGMIPIQGPPEQYAQTADGYLVYPGMNCFKKDGTPFTIGCDRNVASKTREVIALSELFAVAPVKPEPATAETVLREFVAAVDEMVDRGMSSIYAEPFNAVLIKAREALAKPAEPIAVVFTCPKCGSQKSGYSYNHFNSYVCIDCNAYLSSEDIAAACKPKDSIPPGVYWSEDYNCFYSIDPWCDMGVEFYKKWASRRAQFPTDPRVKS